MRKPLVIDLYAGLGGWSDGFLAEGWDCIGFDIERHVYGDHRYPAQLVIQDCLTLDGRQFREATCLVASPPCQFFSYCAMPWSRAKKLAADVRADPKLLEKELALFNACFRIQREACEAAGRHIPMVVENVRGAIPWVGRSRWSHGAFHLWGNVPALMPITLGRQAMKVGVAHHPNGVTNFHGHKAVIANLKDGHRVEVSGFNDGIKVGGSWFGEGNDCSPMRQHSSGSPARKAASAMIARIPEALSRHIARTFRPDNRRDGG